MGRNETMGKVENVSVDGVLRQHSDGPKQSSVGTSGEGSGNGTRNRKRGNRGKNSSGQDRAVAALDNSDATSQGDGTLRTSQAPVLSRRELPVLLSEVPRATKEWLMMLVTGQLWENFFHSRTGEAGCQWAGIIRIAYSIAALGNVILTGLDFKDFFLPSTSRIPLKEGRLTIDQDTWSIFEFLPQTDTVYWVAYWLLFSHVVLLGLGIAPRFQAVFVFFWTCMFRHHNNIIWDDEDTIFKQLAFYLIFFPLDRYTVWTFFKRESKKEEEASWPMWPFRLMQIQMCLVYLSTGLLKWKGNEWIDGSALWYVVHLDELYGNLFNPHWMFGYYSVLKFLTWQTLVSEVACPILVWFDRTRSFALIMIFLFHLGLDLSMNLNFFHWIMSVGWLSFYVQPEKSENGGPPTRKMS
ncbi:Vitamin K-dependent gamma-carboxylase [Seminavis robusta]|uniref:Vitamin K-dependent gamma-carboxylase n=1 Tax=Seminavis robusta TaxID=568900 RepID=A0A9N8E7E6_9STRA|nr:Vitamin K-dependent gamma-carboxylase [Seminavis robusta]|eukprot:Sro762_g198710.1 Vitamin K-dependent gamma-carboxylase (410) ;mRNA; r:26242-27585